jgi:putative nucleotidyltransferase with HDIG domain
LLQALNVLGSELIKTLVISESVYQTFNGFPHASGLDLRGFWKHSLTVAVLARDIAKAMNYAQPEEAYLTGLLHDVGRLALLAAAPNEYVHMFVLPDNAELGVLEQRTLQISHAEAGAWLIERWNLDSFMADSVLYHHENTARLEAAHPLIRIVHLAHVLGDVAADEPPT